MGDLKLHLAHILVAQDFEAQDLLRKLKENISFEDLAKKFSSCPSAKAGGDLGVTALSRLDSVFAEAAGKLKPLEISPVVKTRFGYHLIKRLA